MILPDSYRAIHTTSEIIARGGVIAFRTDTFYGLGADPFNPSAVQQIKNLKGREENKPILVLISDVEHTDRLIQKRSSAFDEVAKLFWPGPLTIIGEATGQLPAALTAGTKTVGVRLPDDDRVRALVRACGGALTATSANPASQPPARTAEEVANYFGERLELIVDGGASTTDRPSTVVDATSPQVKLIREGAVAWAEITVALHRE